jgi:hypothetical protein
VSRNLGDTTQLVFVQEAANPGARCH